MLKKTSILLIISVVSIFFTGCATIVGGGPEQELNFDSNPQGAQVWTGKLKDGQVVDLVNTGEVTPVSMKIAKKNVVVILKKEGYQDTNVLMTQTMNGWFMGNILIGGLIGSSIDFSTGSVNVYDPDNFLLELVPVEE